MSQTEEAIQTTLGELNQRCARGENGVSLQIARYLLDKACVSPPLVAEKLLERARTYLMAPNNPLKASSSKDSLSKSRQSLSPVLSILQQSELELPSQKLTDLEQKMQAQNERFLSEPIDAPKPVKKDIGLRAARRLEQQRQSKKKQKTLEQALQKRPDDPGPLNPEMLAVEVLKELKTVSPAYMDRQLSFIDALVQLDALKLKNPES